MRINVDVGVGTLETDGHRRGRFLILILNTILGYTLLFCVTLWEINIVDSDRFVYHHCSSGQ